MLCFRGFQKGAVEMKRSPNGHWHGFQKEFSFLWSFGGNEEKPEWALTQSFCSYHSQNMICGNEEKPEWALTRYLTVVYFNNSRWKWREARMGIDTRPRSLKRSSMWWWKWREARMGIDTSCFHLLCTRFRTVEMKRSPNGHWHKNGCSTSMARYGCGNEEKPEWALTLLSIHLLAICLHKWKWREARMGIDTTLLCF